MNDDRETLARLLGGLVPPEPPRELQGRVVRKATEALGREAHRDIWTRLWESRPLRLAWAGTVLLFLIGNGVLPARGRTRSVQAVTPRAPAVSSPGDELNSIARLPRIDLATLPGGERAEPAPIERPKPVHLKVKAKESTS
jgi:hypothetical protein